PVSVLHGDLTVEVTTSFVVSQALPHAAGGKTEVVPETEIRAKDKPARSFQLKEGANVEELINGLHAMGATARDIVAILQAIKAAGGLQAELEVL
ncbi:MAG: flagellar basal body P-ring protein FlgI, partial [Solirubrobacteraceae bacterium]